MAYQKKPSNVARSNGPKCEGCGKPSIYAYCDSCAPPTDRRSSRVRIGIKRGTAKIVR